MSDATNFSILQTYNKGPCGIGITAPTWVGIKTNAGYINQGHPNTEYKPLCECRYSANNTDCDMSYIKRQKTKR